MLIHVDQVKQYLIITITTTITNLNYFIFQERALDYLSTCIDQVNSFGDILQLVIVELIYKVEILLLVN